MEMNPMNCKVFTMIAVLVVVLLSVGPSAMAEKPEDPGGGPKDPGGSSDYAVLYGDLYVLERDGNGEPVTTPVTYDDPEDPDPVTVQCPQPIAEDCTFLRLWGQMPDFDLELYDPCEIYVDDLELAHEVSFGRQSVARTDPTVIDSAYFEALKLINSATTYIDSDPDLSVDVPVRLDPASRFELYIPVVEGATECLALEDCTWKTIDSPLENLSLYRALLLDGCLMPITVTRGFTDETNVLSPEAEIHLTAGGLQNLICVDGTEGPVPDAHPEALDMLLAAAFWGGSADKTSHVSLDEFINANNYLGINTYVAVGGTKKKPELEFTYFDFEPFTYSRASTHPWGGGTGEGLPIPSTATLLSLDTNETEPTFVIADAQVLFGPTSPPSIDLEGVNVGVCRDQVMMGPCLGADGEGECGAANYFAQAAEDSRKIIWFLHNWSIPEIDW
jgi:hypothetical protein